jgi:2-polyprenyl-6-methoxyphenol hydroxylase-like FAD-dependent oxidoreductase
VRVIIVGSGIAGLAAGIALRRVGIEVCVYERAPELREVGAGISLWANAIRVLDRLGVGGAIRQKALSLTRSELRVADGFRQAVQYTSTQLEAKLKFHPVVAMIHRADVIGALAAALPADLIRCGHACTGVAAEGDRVVVRFANGQRDEADAVVGADGIRSAVRASLFGNEPPRYSGYTCWRGIAPRPAILEPGYVGESWGRGRRFGITTLTDDRVYWFAARNAPAGFDFGDPKTTLAELFRGWADPIPEVIASTPCDQLIHGDILDRVPSKVWSVDRVGLIGDAAHPTTPNLGQGGCLALEDSIVLARSFATNTDPAVAWQAFAAKRAPRTAAIVNESWRIGRVGQYEGWLTCKLRDAVARVALPLMGSGSFLKSAAFDVGPLPSS